MYKEGRDVLEEETREIDDCDVEEVGPLDSSEKTIAILGDRWWPQAAKQKGDNINNKFLCNTWKQPNERPNVGGVSTRSRDGAPLRKGCVFNGKMTKASKQMSTPPPPTPPPSLAPSNRPSSLASDS